MADFCGFWAKIGVLGVFFCVCQRGWWRGEPKIRDVVGDGLVLVAV